MKKSELKKTAELQRRKYVKAVFLLIVLLITASVFFYSLTLQEAYKKGIETIAESIHEHNIKGSISFIILEALAVMFSPFSSVPFLVVAIGVWGKSIALIYSVIGGLLGAIITYKIGSHPLSYIMKKFVPAKEIHHYRKIMAKHSSFWFVFLFILSMPVEIPGYVLGLVRYDFRKYVLATVLGHLPFYVLTIFAGYAFTENNIITFTVLIGVLLLLFLISAYAFYQKLKKDNKQKTNIENKKQ